MAPSTRRYDLDWLRVILFGLLVPFHALIGFVSYGTDIYGYQNPETAGWFAELLIYFSHAWRLPALFMISGMGSCILFRSRGAKGFLKNRVIRLLIPLLVGSFLWNSIYGYHRVLVDGYDLGFWHYWMWWIENPKFSHVRHLWFLVNLLISCVIAIPAFIYLSKPVRARFLAKAGLPLTFLAMLVTELLLKPLDGNVRGISFQSVIFFLFYLLGFWTQAQGSWVWNVLRSKRRHLLIASCCNFLLLSLFLGAYESDIGSTNLLIAGGWYNNGWAFQSPVTAGYSLVYTTNSLLWCLTVFGFGYHHLNHPGPVLEFLNRAVYPFYIFHFIVMMVGLYYLRLIVMPWFIGFLLLVVGTYLATLAIFLIFDRFPLIGWAVGIKPKTHPS